MYQVYNYYRGKQNQRGEYKNPFAIITKNGQKENVVMKIISVGSNEIYRVLFDYCDLKDIIKYNWCKLKNGYICTTSSPKTYLHRMVAKKNLQNQNNLKYIDHLNRNPFDNRVCNLKYSTQSEQNQNQGKHSRIQNHPLKDNTEVRPNEIPKYIWYRLPRSELHSDCFCVEKHPNQITKDGEIITYQCYGETITKKVSRRINTSSSKNISLRNKLNEAIKIKEALGPVPNTHNNNGELNNAKNIKLLNEYNMLIQLIR